MNRWLFMRYLVIGLYVGCVTCAGFAWWYTWAPVSDSPPTTSMCFWSPSEMAVVSHGGDGGICASSVLICCGSHVQAVIGMTAVVGRQALPCSRGGSDVSAVAALGLRC